MKTSSISIVNGRLIDPANNIDKVTNIHISRGKIVAIGRKPSCQKQNCMPRPG